MADVAPPPGSHKPLIIDLNEPQSSEDETAERRLSLPGRLEASLDGDTAGLDGAFPNVRKAYWRSASWTPARAGRPSLQRTMSGKAPGFHRANGKLSTEQDGTMGKGKGLRIQVDNGWKGDVEVIKLSGEQNSSPTAQGGQSQRPNRPPRGMPGMQLDLGALQMNSQAAEPTEIQMRRNKIAFFEKHCSKVAEHVYLGSDVVARNREILRESGITHVLNCVGFVCPEYFAGELVYKTLWLQDIPGQDLTNILYNIFDYLEEVRTQHGRVFVHCCLGVSRSTSLVIAYLMWRDNRPFDETFRDVKAIRGTANPNMGFACQLLQWQKRITWGPGGDPPPHSGRMYRIAPHSPFDPLYLVPKPVGKLSGAELDQRGVFVVDSPSGEVFVWLGEAAQPKMAEAGGRVAAQLMKYERAKGPVTVVRQGQEVARFWEVLNAEGGDEASEDEARAVDRDQARGLERSPSSRTGGANTSANPSANPDGSWRVSTFPTYDADFDLFTRAENGEIKTAVPGSSALPRSASAEPPKRPVQAKEDQKQSAHSGAPSPRGEPVLKTDMDSAVESDKQAVSDRDQKAGEEQPPPPEKKPASGSSRKQAQPDVFVPSVSRAYPVSTLPPPSPSLPPPNKRSKSPTMTEAGDALSPPPPSPSSSMGSFYKQHRVLSPRPVPDLTEVKPRKSPSMLGPGSSDPPPRRRSSLSGDTKSLAPLEGSRRLEWGLLKESELSSQASRQPWPPVPESPRPLPSSAASPAPPVVNSPDFGALEQAWTVPESPRGPRRTSFPGFAVSRSEAEIPKTPGAKPRGHRHSSMGGVKAKEIDLTEKPLVDAQHKHEAEGKERPEGGRESDPQEGSGLLEPGKSTFSDEPKPADGLEAGSWTAGRPALKITGVDHPKFDDAPASPVGPLPGSEILSPGESEETKSLVTELLPPTAEKPELASEAGDLCASTESPMEVDRRQSLCRRGTPTPLGRSGGEETAGGPRLFEAPLFQEVEMFDTDDLHSESAYVLLVDTDGNSKGMSGVEGREVYVWLGADYLKQGDERRASSGSAMLTDSGDREEGLKDGKGLGEEFVRRRGLPSRSPIMVIVEGREPDDFWSHFVNG